MAILGAGGAARAAAFALVRAGARVTVARAAAGAGGRGGGRDRLRLRRARRTSRRSPWDVLVNATPVGSGAFPGESPVPAGRAAAGQRRLRHGLRAARDAAPRRRARERAASTIDGVEMLVAQAVGQFEAWTGAPAPVEAMTEAALARDRRGARRAPAGASARERAPAGPGPARRAVLRGRGGPAPAPHRGGRGVGLRGLGLRGDHPAALRLRRRLRRRGARPEDLLVRGPRRERARAAARLHEPRSPRSPPGGCATARRRCASTTRARSCATSRCKAGRQSELHQMGLEHLGGDARAADAEVLAIAAECLERLGRARLRPGPRPRGGLRRPRRGGGARRRSALEALRERVESKDPAGVRQALEGAGAPPAAAAALERLTRSAGGLEALARGGAGVRLLRAGGGGGRGAARGGRGAARRRPRRPPGRGPRRGARPRLLHRPRLPRLRARPRLRGGRRRPLRHAPRALRPPAARRRLHAGPRPRGAAARAPGPARGRAAAARRSRVAATDLGAALAGRRARARRAARASASGTAARGEPHRRALEGQAARRVGGALPPRGPALPERRGPQARRARRATCASCS